LVIEGGLPGPEADLRMAAEGFEKARWRSEIPVGESRRMGSRSVRHALGVIFMLGGSFDRATIARHLALCLAALAAYLMQFELRVGLEVLWIIGAAALLNLLTFLLSDAPRLGTLSRLLSPAFGVGGWTALVYLTGGVPSPFVAGFGLEILLAARTFLLAGTVVVTAATVAALWTQQALLGLQGLMTSLVVHSGGLIGLGAVTSFLVRHWLREQLALEAHSGEIRNRLDGLEEELEAMRRFGKMGENVARLAHGLKNTVHALRGFAELIGQRVGGEGKDMPALKGLWAAIDQLEALARLTLDKGGMAREGGGTACAQVQGTVAEAVEEVSAGYPAITWERAGGEAAASVRAPTAALREVLVELFRNAAEAMGGEGRIKVVVAVHGDAVRIQVRDQGAGVSEHDLRNLFKPGYTTKAGGTGLGLFFARRLLESHSGALTVRAARGGGALFTAELPSAMREDHSAMEAGRASE
jgi:signal transduction histidine kinase